MKPSVPPPPNYAPLQELPPNWFAKVEEVLLLIQDIQNLEETKLDNDKIIPTNLLGSGAANITKYLRGDQTWATVPTTDAYFVFTQGVASNTWDVTHNLGKKPSVTVVDSVGNEMVGQTIYINDNQLQICFSAPFSGKAYLN